MTAVVYLGIPFILLLLGFPIFVVLVITALTAIWTVAPVTSTVVHTMMFGSLDAVPLLAVPFFVLAGDIMGQGGLARRLISWTLSIIGGVRGSLALTTVASSELFGAMSGSSVGCIAAVGRVLYPAMRQNGYGVKLSSGLIASSGSIAIVIPPSIAMIIYGISAQQSVTQLFLAGIVPGILMGILISIYLLLWSGVRMVAPTSPMRWHNVWVTTKETFWALTVPVVIFGGIYGGVFTPTEAGGIAVVYATFVVKYIYREVTWQDLWRITKGSAYLSAQIMIIVAAAGLYSWLITTSGMPQYLVQVIGDLELQPWMLLLAFNIILLLAGSFLEPPAAILMLAPVFLPLVQAAGVDLIHFGIIMTVNLAIGMFIPPFGLNIFATHAIFNVPLKQLYAGVFPFILVNLITLGLITYIPSLSLGLVRYFGLL